MQNARFILKCVLFRGETESERERKREKGEEVCNRHYSTAHQCLPEHLFSLQEHCKERHYITVHLSFLWDK